MNDVRLLTLDPAHFHAALVQKEMYEGVSPQVHVYAPPGADLLAHQKRIDSFNSRADRPTSWKSEIHAGDDFLERLLRDRRGNVVILAGRNHRKIDYLEAAVNAGFHVLADKPWILVPEHLPRLQAVLDTAEQRGVVAYDIMTERHEITSILQKELVQDPEVFGTPVAGSEQEPGVFMESVHYLCKQVAGVPLQRPASFFDVHQQGEGLTDVGTHLVDLVPWMLFPEQALDDRREVVVHSAKRWPTILRRADFQRVTGEADFPDFLQAQLRQQQLDYFCNTAAGYSLRGIRVQLNVLWHFAAAEGTGDSHLAIFRGTRARVEIRQGPEEHFRLELYVVPVNLGPQNEVRAALQDRLKQLGERFPGLGLEELAGRFRLLIPDAYRVGHEAHFAAVTRQFLRYVRDPKQLPTWEKPMMLAKYFVTTQGVAQSRA